MRLTTLTLQLEGMTCGHCATRIEQLLTQQPGVKTASVSYPQASGICTFDPGRTSQAAIIQAIDRTNAYRVKGEMAHDSQASKPPFDLMIVGGGSAAFAAAIEAERLGLSTLMVNGGLDWGGTCVNVGCVPSKNLIRAGEAAYHATHARFEGVRPRGVDLDFAQVMRDKDALIARLRTQKYQEVVQDFAHLTRLQGWARFRDPQTIEVDGQLYQGRKVLLATGARPHIPAIAGLEQVPYLTHVSLFALETQPESLIILGGGYVALEIAQAYQRLGTQVTLLQRSAHVLSPLTPDVSEALLAELRAEGVIAHTGLRFEQVYEEEGQIKVAARNGESRHVFKAEKMMLATGTQPQTDQLGLENIGLRLTPSGHVWVNDKMETNLPQLYAAGDVAHTPAFVYTAALEGKIAVQNAFSGAGRQTDYTALPWVIFTDPQVAGVGLDEAEAAAQGIPFEVSKVALQDVPSAIVANDLRGFIKLIRNPETDRLIGARVVAPAGGELVHALSLAIQYRIPVQELAAQIFPYLTLSEGIKLAALSFGQDVAKLSCCAS